jgi:hypothetical protein
VRNELERKHKHQQKLKAGLEQLKTKMTALVLEHWWFDCRKILRVKQTGKLCRIYMFYK